MQSCLFAITALLLGCGAQGLRVAEGPSDTDQPTVSLQQSPFLTWYTAHKEKMWTNIILEKLEHAEKHDLELIADTNISDIWAEVPDMPKFDMPGLVNMATLANKALQGSPGGCKGVALEGCDDRHKAWLTINVAFLAMGGAADAYSDFSAWWGKAFGDATMVSTDAFVKELTDLMPLGFSWLWSGSAEMANLTDAHPDLEEDARGAANLMDFNSDGMLNRGEVLNFAQSLQYLGCKGLAAPVGFTLPKKACASPEESAPESKEHLRVAPTYLDKWLSGAQYIE